jgi:hypothetical protein
MTLTRRLAIVLTALVPVSVALAQPKPALVQNRDEPGRTPYLEAVQVSDSDPQCNPTACHYDFTTVPAGKRLVVTHVAVSVGTSGGTFAAAFLMRNGGDVIPLGTMQRGGPRFYLSTPVTYFVEPGQTPRMELVCDAVDEGQYLGAALIGYYVSLP